MRAKTQQQEEEETQFFLSQDVDNDNGDCFLGGCGLGLSSDSGVHTSIMERAEDIKGYYNKIRPKIYKQCIYNGMCLHQMQVEQLIHG